MKKKIAAVLLATSMLLGIGAAPAMAGPWPIHYHYRCSGGYTNPAPWTHGYVYDAARKQHKTDLIENAWSYCKVKHTYREYITAKQAWVGRGSEYQTIWK